MNELLVKPFDVGRAALEDYLDGSLYPACLDVTETQPLRDALAAGSILADSTVLTATHDNVLYVFPMSVVLSYNVIQGTTNGQHWVMTFCKRCKRA
ncbi:MAG: hypothetical protein H7Y11_00145 [Armatimonadetes bacterium]|nr:hypothetical protein [Anaerolineae bacterium]